MCRLKIKYNQLPSSKSYIKQCGHVPMHLIQKHYQVVTEKELKKKIECYNNDTLICTIKQQGFHYAFGIKIMLPCLNCMTYIL